MVAVRIETTVARNIYLDFTNVALVDLLNLIVRAIYPILLVTRNCDAF
jgi:hypothetical protein